LERSGRTFEPADRRIGIKPNYQQFTKGTSLGEIFDMSSVQNIKYTIGEDDSFA
jgi:hypothetical protein